MEEFRKLTGIRTPTTLTEVYEMVNHPTPEEAAQQAEQKADFLRRSRETDAMMERWMAENPESAEAIRNAKLPPPPWWESRFIAVPLAWIIVAIMGVLFVVGILVTPPVDNPILRQIWTVIHNILTLTQ